VSQLDISRFTYFIAPLDDPAGQSFVGWSWGATADQDIAAVHTGGRRTSTPLQKDTENQHPDLYYVKLTGVMVAAFDGVQQTVLVRGG
jgi:hypothetical protein